jgi:hypothetical protein
MYFEFSGLPGIRHKRTWQTENISPELDETQSHSPNPCNFSSSFLKMLIKLVGMTTNGHFPHIIRQEMNKSRSV